jgi:transporter family-2 protein
MGRNTSSTISGVPWVYLLGGCFGFTVILCVVLAFPHLGAAYTMALMVLGQGAMALLIDHHGLWGAARISASWPRFAGVSLLLAGVLLLRAR